MAYKYISDKAGVIVFPPSLYFFTLLTGLLLSYFFPYHFISTDDAAIIGILVFLFSILILISAVRQLNKHKTTINPRGSTTAIVCEGIYKFSRNPMYVSFTLFYIGISMIFSAWLGLLLLIPLLIIVQKGIIEREERYLTRKFGDKYLVYKAKVRRWL